MRLTAIRLENTRKFADPIEITGIGAGLNVLSAANEQGKSTIFDALHAVFFKDAKSWDKEIRALAPRAGGEPCVEIEMELHDGSYRLSKQFRKGSGKGEVRIWKGAQLFLQSDAAEAWLKALIKSPKDGGPAGLLWVRQGVTDFSDAKETLAARQDLMSSVAGEVDAVTGGQRMDAIRRDVRQSLDSLVTSRGAKKGGPLDLAEAQVQHLENREAELAAKVQVLRSQLEQRKTMRRDLAEVQDPVLQQEQETRLREAQSALDQAQRYQEKLEAATQGWRNAQLLVENSEGQLAVLNTQLRDLEEASQECAAASGALQQARDLLAPSQAELVALGAQLSEAQDQAKSVEEHLSQLLRAERLAQVAGQRKRLEQHLQQARALQKQLTRLQNQVAQAPDANLEDRIEQAQAALMQAQQAQAMAAASLTVTYEAGQEGKLLLGEEPLSQGERISLSEPGRLMVPGVARIDIHPGQGGGRSQLRKAEDVLAALLNKADCRDLDQAREKFRAREQASRDMREVEVQLQILAPDGVADLMQQLDALPETEGQVDRRPSADEIAQAQDDLSKARATRDRALALRDAKQVQEAERRQAVERFDAQCQAGQQRMDRAKAALAAHPDPVAAKADLEQSHKDKQTQADQAALALARLKEQAPDLDTARAQARRAQSALTTSREKVQELTRDLAVLDSQIAATAGEAVEEELAEVRDRLASAHKDLAALRQEVATLRRLDSALVQAREAAQEAYVGPVLKELQPLLRLLWPQAQLSVDAGQILPEALQREGEAETFDSLSGGTQEQIALLVRLAFARLLARNGNAAPVILDDAIVYTDDARIERIFDALTLQAEELQILVFTCRQKSFRSLGGTQLSIRPVSNMV